MNEDTLDKLTETHTSFEEGMKYYRNLDYVNAFQCFLNIVEGDKNQYSIHELTMANYYLSVMYKSGIGTSKDSEKSSRHLRVAADYGYDQAQLEMGEQIISRPTYVTVGAQEEGFSREGLAYLEKAADSGLLEAVKKYVEYATSLKETNSHVKSKLRIYIPLLKPYIDEAENAMYEQLFTDLCLDEKKEKKRDIYKCLFVAAEILFLIGTLYLFKGLNNKFFTEIFPIAGRIVPNFPEVMIIKWPGLIAFTAKYMTVQGIFGCWLLLIGNVIREVSIRHSVERHVASGYKAINIIVRVLVILLVVFHFVVNILETGNPIGNGSLFQFASMLINVFVGRLIGFILYKILSKNGI